MLSSSTGSSDTTGNGCTVAAGSDGATGFTPDGKGLYVQSPMNSEMTRLVVLDASSGKEVKEIAASVEWRLGDFRRENPGEHFEELAEGSLYRVEARDSVTSAPELARLTLNIAKTHTDAASSPYGKRLVYGGYTISMASAQIVRALPNLVTLIAWRSCDHTEPVFEGDILRTEFTIDARHTLASGGGLVDLHAVVHAARGDQAPTLGEDVSVLDWRVIGLMA